MDIDSFFTNGDLSFGMDGNVNFGGTGQNAWKHKGEYKFAEKPEYGFENDPEYAQMGGAGIGEDETHFNAYGGTNPDRWNKLRKADREGHGLRKYLDKLSEADLKDCKVLDATLTKIKNEIIENERNALKDKKTARVMAGYNRGLGYAKDEVVKIMSKLQCGLQDEAEFMQQISTISGGSQTSKWVLYGGIGVAVLGLGIVLVRALRK